MLVSKARCVYPKSRMRAYLSPSQRFIQSSTGTAPPPLAFVFDIDGVLIRGPHVLPEAKQALRILQGDNPFKTKIPFLLLTNGGGVSEEERTRSLSTKLEVPIHQSQYLQAHTILKKHVHRFSDKPVLVLGGKLDKVRQVAESYGFKHAYTSLDILAWKPSVWPFHQLTEAEKSVAKIADFSEVPISAIFVFHDPRNWALDVQIITDIVQSGGIVGGPPIPLENQAKPVEVVFCNPDLLWRSDFPRPRLGQGAFKEAFQAVFKAVTGYEHPHVQYGKPTKDTYDFARDALKSHFQQHYGLSSAVPNLYMIGDNPESDIAGANAAQWHSVLVRTGVYDPNHGPPNHTPTHIADDVLAAVEWAVEREYSYHQARTSSHRPPKSQ